MAEWVLRWLCCCLSLLRKWDVEVVGMLGCGRMYAAVPRYVQLCIACKDC